MKQVLIAAGILELAALPTWAALRQGTTPAAGAAADAEPRGTAERIATYLAGWERRDELSGVVLAARRDQVVFRRAYGLADVERGTANDPATCFQIASLTKTFTAAAILLLESTGELSFSDPLTRFMPDYPRGDEIRLEHLLSHSAGIPDHHGMPGFEEKTVQGISLEELVRWQSEFPLEFDPGTDSRYGNSDYAVLARVVEIVSGQSFPDFVRENLLEPLEMEATGEVGATYPGARGYFFGPPPSHRIAVPDRDYSYAMGSGSLYSTAGDLLRWLRAIDRRTLVDVRRTSWPFGWGRESYGRLQALEQTGMHAGFTATMTVVPEEHVYVVHLSNVQAGLAFQRIHRDLVRILLGEDIQAPPPLPAVSWNPSEGERYAGRYDSGEDWKPSLVADGRGLWWRAGDERPPQYLEPSGPGRFLKVDDGCELVFRPPSAGAEPSFDLHMPWSPNGPHPRYVRVP